MNVIVGQKAPKFKLFDTEKLPHYIDDYKGRNVVLLFIPFAFSSTCTKEFSKMRDEQAYYEKLGVDIIGVSVDSLYTLKRWKEELKLDFTLLSDFNKEVSQAYDSLYADWDFGYKGVSKRSAFVIDRESIVRYIEILENASHLPNFSAINMVLNKL
jgi:glutaredoxin-dependent peroxiredoxin